MSVNNNILCDDNNLSIKYPANPHGSSYDLMTYFQGSLKHIYMVLFYFSFFVFFSYLFI